MSRIITLEDFCEGAGMPRAAMLDLVEVLHDGETARLAEANAKMARCAKRADAEALPLTEGGHEWGRVEARIPAELFFNLAQQKRFGYEGLTSEDGIKDVLKDFPACRVETVSGRIVSGYTGPQRTIVKKYG